MKLGRFTSAILALAACSLFSIRPVNALVKPTAASYSGCAKRARVWRSR